MGGEEKTRLPVVSKASVLLRLEDFHLSSLPTTARRPSGIGSDLDLLLFSLSDGRLPGIRRR